MPSGHKKKKTADRPQRKKSKASVLDLEAVEDDEADGEDLKPEEPSASEGEDEEISAKKKVSLQSLQLDMLCVLLHRLKSSQGRVAGLAGRSVDDCLRIAMRTTRLRRTMPKLLRFACHCSSFCLG